MFPSGGSVSVPFPPFHCCRAGITRGHGSCANIGRHIAHIHKMSIFFVISFSCWGMPDVCRRIGQAVRRVRSAWIENSGKLEKKCEVVKRLWKKCIRGSRLLFNRLFFSIRYRPVGADPCVRPDILAWRHRRLYLQLNERAVLSCRDCSIFQMKKRLDVFKKRLGVSTETSGRFRQNA